MHMPSASHTNIHIHIHTNVHTDDHTVHGGFHITVLNGSRPADNKCNKNGIATRVVLTCNTSASWKQQDVSNFIRVVYEGALDPCEVSLASSYSSKEEWVEPGDDT